MCCPEAFPESCLCDSLVCPGAGGILAAKRSKRFPAIGRLFDSVSDCEPGVDWWLHSDHHAHGNFLLRPWTAGFSALHVHATVELGSDMQPCSNAYRDHVRFLFSPF